MTTTLRRPLRLVLVALAALALVAGLAACGSDSESSDEATTDTTAASGSSDTTAAAGDVVSDEDGLTIAAPWARTSPMDTTYGAVYLELTSADGDALFGASVPEDVAGTVEIHETVAADEADGDAMDMSGDESSDTTMAGMDHSSDTTMAGMGAMTMQPIEALDLPAGETVVLEPGGFHIMLIDLVAPLETGEEIEVTLTFENAGERTVTVPVLDDAP
ncbi:MAG: copper chaperone PCu(A)C [Acidimicrobiales bacterium]|nr:copper chaperone PCu(A)C [Acidimicrobiales bacterium]MCB9373416.1 copper chaperone PCu(A)C [Microthrixaceae bacterium]